MDLYRKLTARIELSFEDLKVSNLFYQRIFSGQTTVAEFTSFLKNVSYLTAHTPAHLRLAQKSALTRGHPKLARYFLEKLGEEVDHDKWGEADVKGIAKLFPLPETTHEIVAGMQSFIRENERLIHDNPFQYVIYILFAEYFTVIAGPQSLAAIEASCRIPREHMSIIGKHVDLDQHHVHEWAQATRDLGLDLRDDRYWLEVLEGIISRYDQFCLQLSVRHAAAA